MESRLMHIEYETSTEKNWKPQDATISVLSIREKDLKQIIFSSSCGAQVVFTRDDVVKALTQYQQRTTSDIRHEKVQEALKDLKNSMKKDEETGDKNLKQGYCPSCGAAFLYYPGTIDCAGHMPEKCQICGKDLPFPMNGGPDPWKHRSIGMRCKTCMFYVPKEQD